ncbi:protein MICRORCHIDIA 6 isoform X1 [Phoenix dactylifera]|uniref:Protein MICRORCHIDIA 6 isoform X1 n=1 Tax=Phoenix dactylifera TaxID=42345 RepID=A0A8B8J5J1_PHODC|nr:protein MICRORCHIDIA 6 isoform X1 [Phoenix dactylifera]XP_026660841.2 protein MICRORCHIDIA 6 isoform X1 [Phoenix dactylifera]
MSFPDVIDLSSDEEIEEAHANDVKPLLSANSLSKCEEYAIKQEVEERRSSNSCSCISEQGSSSANGFASPPGSPGSPVPLCRQFWKSGDYEPRQAFAQVSQSGTDRLRIHPKFLHSNATSHKWAFGAIAELLDNAVDELQNGATFVVIDKFINPRNGNPALLIRDDGGGMDPESLRRCMSFGFSDKHSDSSIGQYGNGFKTSTMRLGADVIVFSRCTKKRILTQSIGLLSYTFLRQTGCDDIVVPAVDYEFDPHTTLFERLCRHNTKQFSDNLLMLLKWSPFSTEAELLKQFDEVGPHGTKIIVYNLWFNDDGHMELDFESDPKDITICGAHRSVQKNGKGSVLTQKYIANRLHYSLRAYISILYLHSPEHFRIILRGQVVEPHHIANDLIYRECVLYKPQVGGVMEAAVITTIGFLEGAPDINVHGFNIYHKNRLILPFKGVANNSYGKGRGVVGVLEANFIKPTHDKQDFEKSNLYQKLETRLKEMTYEYWDLHCHLVGYDNKKKPTTSGPAAPGHHMHQLRTSSSLQQVKMNSGALASSQLLPNPNVSASNRVVTALTVQMKSTAGQFSNCDAGAQTWLPLKRKHESHNAAADASKRQAKSNAAGLGSTQKHDRGIGQKRMHEIKTMILENKKLRKQCLEYELMEKQLKLKEQKFRSELQEVQELYKKLLVQLRSLDEVKVEK